MAWGYTVIAAVMNGWAAFWDGVDDRFVAYLTAPHYDDLAYVQVACERLQSCPSDHSPRRHVIITPRASGRRSIYPY